jgi:hypothetical protein
MPEHSGWQRRLRISAFTAPRAERYTLRYSASRHAALGRAELDGRPHAVRLSGSVSSSGGVTSGGHAPSEGLAVPQGAVEHHIVLPELHVTERDPSLHGRVGGRSTAHLCHGAPSDGQSAVHRCRIWRPCHPPPAWSQAQLLLCTCMAHVWNFGGGRGLGRGRAAPLADC